MGWDVQINPTAEAHGVSRELVQLLDRYVMDFEMRYCFIDPERVREAIASLKSFKTDWPDEARAIRDMVSLLEGEEPVELLFGH